MRSAAALRVTSCGWCLLLAPLRGLRSVREHLVDASAEGIASI